MFGIKMPWTKRKEEAAKAEKRRAEQARQWEIAQRSRSINYYAPSSRSAEVVHSHNEVSAVPSGMSYLDMVMMQSLMSSHSSSLSPESAQSFTGGGGTFDGAGASGDWSSSSSCDSGGSSSSSSDSSSSCSPDSGSSSSSGDY